MYTIQVHIIKKTFVSALCNMFKIINGVIGLKCKLLERERERERKEIFNTLKLLWSYWENKYFLTIKFGGLLS